MEKLIGDSADRHAREIQNLKGSHERSHASINDRIGYLEKTVGDSAEKHEQELQSVKDAHAMDLKQIRSAHATTL